MSDPTDRLATVRAALDLMLRVWPGPLYVRRFVDDTGNDAAAVIDNSTGETIAICDNEDRDDHAAPAEDAAAIVALRNAAPAIAALADECERLRAAVSALDLKVADTVRRWDEASDEERIRREVIERELADSDADRRRHFATLCRERDINMEARARIATLEAELAQARAHQCGGIVLRAEDADRIAALLEDPPAPTPAMVALFDKAKECAIAAPRVVARLTAELAAARMIIAEQRTWLGSSEAAKSQPRTDTGDIAADVLACAEAWAPEARIIGNVRADEIAAVCRELAAARAVPADVEAAIDAYEARVTSLVTSMTGRAADDAVAVDVARNNLRAIITRAITEDRAAAPSTVGGLLATAPVGSIVEYLDADGDIWHQVEFNATMTAHRRRIDAWGGWKLRDMPMRELRQRARLVPADQADLDPSTRGPIGEG